MQAGYPGWPQACPLSTHPPTAAKGNGARVTQNDPRPTQQSNRRSTSKIALQWKLAKTAVIEESTTHQSVTGLPGMTPSLPLSWKNSYLLRRNVTSRWATRDDPRPALSVINPCYVAWIWRQRMGDVAATQKDVDPEDVDSTSLQLSVLQCLYYFAGLSFWVWDPCESPWSFWRPSLLHPIRSKCSAHSEPTWEQSRYHALLHSDWSLIQKIRFWPFGQIWTGCHGCYTSAARSLWSWRPWSREEVTTHLQNGCWKKEWLLSHSSSRWCDIHSYLLSFFLHGGTKSFIWLSSACFRDH